MAKIAKKVKLANGLRFEFADAKKTVLEYNLSLLSETLRTELAIHGLSQKLGDSYSGLETVAEAMAMVKSVWANLLADKFNASVSGSGLLAEAVARIKGISIAEAEAKLATADAEVIEKLKGNVKVKAVMVVIRGERAKVTVDAAVDDLGI